MTERENGGGTAHLDARLCRRCGHAARYYSTARGFCELVLSDGGGEGGTRWYCGCRCEWAPLDTPHDPSGEVEP